MVADFDSFVPIAVDRRSGYDESFHLGAAVVVDPAGSVVASRGDHDVGIYPRSALKPLQATAMVTAGLDLPARLLAVATASHSGEPEHLAAVLEILDRAGLGVDALDNTATLPGGEAARHDALRAGLGPSSLMQSCSGKHAGMLATCVTNGWPVDDYLDVDHPLQRHIVAELDRLGAPVGHIGVDGCGAPTHVLRLSDLARAVGRVGGPGSPAPSVAAAMRDHPWMVAGTGRDVTEWMDAVPGLIVKDGAAGVVVAALADGSAGAVKIADGSPEATRALVPQLLRELGVDVDGAYVAVRDRLGVDVLGHGRPVGAVEALAWSS